MRLLALIKSVALACLLLFATRAAATGMDLHALWHDRCAECHGHSADFARRFLTLDGDRLQGRHHLQDLDRFMQYHYAPRGEADALRRMLRAQVQTPPRFQQECSRCHGRAADFVRRSISLQSGELIIRKSGGAVAEFMRDHRGLSAGDVEFYQRLLARLANEIYRP